MLRAQLTTPANVSKAAIIPTPLSLAMVLDMSVTVEPMLVRLLSTQNPALIAPAAEAVETTRPALKVHPSCGMSDLRLVRSHDNARCAATTL
jgi:hypothetical protein